jgi:hypothetical protein
VIDAAAPVTTAARVRPLVLVLGGSLAVGALSLLLPSTPSYDPWAWLIWGREIAGGELDTTAGPAWKPLPVAFGVLLAPFGAAPELWLALARAAAVAAVLAVGALAWRLSGGRRVAAVVAGGSLVLVAGFVRGAALGFSEGLLVALVAAAALRHLDGARRQALLLGVAAALLRPEVWPFLLAYGVWLWRRREDRPLLVTAAVVPAAWFLPELWGSGELLRSTERARIPNPGQPALAEVPALEVVERFVLMTPPLVLAGLALALRRGLDLVRPGRATWSDLLNLPALAAFAWVGLVALMSQLGGFSGEERYLVPAAAAACVAAGVAWAALPLRRTTVLAAAALVLLSAPFVAAGAADLRRDLADDAALRTDLESAIERAGGAEQLRCGAFAAGRYRFPLVAWHLDVPISAVGFDLGGERGVVLRSRLRRGEPSVPPAPAAGELVGAAGTWELWSTC